MDFRLARELVDSTSKRTPIIKLIDFEKRKFSVILRDHNKGKETTVQFISSECPEEKRTGNVCKVGQCLDF